MPSKKHPLYENEPLKGVPPVWTTWKKGAFLGTKFHKEQHLARRRVWPVEPGQDVSPFRALSEREGTAV